MIQEPSVNRKMIDEIEVLLQNGWSAAAIRDELSTRGFDGPNIDRIIAFSFRDLYSEKLTLDALQHARNEREQAADQDGIAEKTLKEGRHQKEAAAALATEQDYRKRQENDRLAIDEERRIEDNEALKRTQKVEDDYQNDMDKRILQEEAEDKRLRDITMY